MKRSSKDLSVIILAAAPSKGMVKHGSCSLLLLDDKTTLIEHQIQTINKIYEPDEIIVVGGYDIASVYQKIKYRARLIENERYSSSNTCRSLGIGLMATNSKRILVMHGDLYFQTLPLFDLDKPSVFVGGITAQKEAGVIVVEDYIENIYFGLVPKWSQIVYLTPKVIDGVISFCLSPRYHNNFLFECINYSIGLGYRYSSIKCRGPIYDIDSLKELKASRAHFNS